MQGKLVEAEDLQVLVIEKSERVLGEKRSLTLDYKKKLGSTYRMLCKLKDAEQLETNLVETSKIVLGTENPLTLIYMHALAHTYTLENHPHGAVE